MHACAPGQARPWRPIHSQLNSVPLALGSTLLRHARRTRSQSRSSLTHPSLRRSARADPPAPPTVSAGASAVSERLRDCQADLTLVRWWHCSRRPSSWLRLASEAVVQGTSPHGMLRASAVRSPQCISRCCCVGTLNRRVSAIYSMRWTGAGDVCRRTAARQCAAPSLQEFAALWHISCNIRGSQPSLSDCKSLHRRPSGPAEPRRSSCTVAYAAQRRRLLSRSNAVRATVATRPSQGYFSTL